jgi:hypothetical protein
MTPAFAKVDPKSNVAAKVAVAIVFLKFFIFFSSEFFFEAFRFVVPFTTSSGVPRFTDENKYDKHCI